MFKIEKISKNRSVLKQNNIQKVVRNIICKTKHHYSPKRVNQYCHSYHK